MSEPQRTRSDLAVAALLGRGAILGTISISLLVLVGSIGGLASSAPYANETADWALQARGQDLGNLIVVAVLIVSTIAAVRGSAAGLFVWMGALVYVTYVYVIYAFALHVGVFYLLYLAILGLTFFPLGRRLVAALDPALPPVRSGQRATRFAGITLITIAVLFGILWLSELVPALLAGTTPPSVASAGLMVNPVHSIDLSIVLPSMIVTGIGALRGRSAGLLLIAPWLSFSVLMGTSLLVLLGLQAADAAGAVLPVLIAVSIVVVVSAAAFVVLRRNSVSAGPVA
ncbi:hypothetical protein [Agromyces sp. Soil535]|uniref:hypothetical protein n=1 Tax=Agromyces sp. Soil535 TaxID=1736390 RepID=UPI0006F574DE|nr:hypothetical protein [Agromyces sp. Soil535]KRE30512.1 hypothetical protein ASG80_17370 [Agromyces sp. Soil535]